MSHFNDLPAEIIILILDYLTYDLPLEHDILSGRLISSRLNEIILKNKELHQICLDKKHFWGKLLDENDCTNQSAKPLVQMVKEKYPQLNESYKQLNTILDSEGTERKKAKQLREIAVNDSTSAALCVCHPKIRKTFFVETPNLYASAEQNNSVSITHDLLMDIMPIACKYEAFALLILKDTEIRSKFVQHRDPPNRVLCGWDSIVDIASHHESVSQFILSNHELRSICLAEQRGGGEIITTIAMRHKSTTLYALNDSELRDAMFNHTRPCIGQLIQLFSDYSEAVMCLASHHIIRNDFLELLSNIELNDARFMLLEIGKKYEAAPLVEYVVLESDDIQSFFDQYNFSQVIDHIVNKLSAQPEEVYATENKNFLSSLYGRMLNR